jgi:glycogen phosphorylase
MSEVRQVAASPERSAGTGYSASRGGAGSPPLAGTPDSLYDRHLLLDRAVSPDQATPRDRFEALAHAVRDALACRWALTRDTYARRDPKIVSYLSMEYLLGRSLEGNIGNLGLEAHLRDLVTQAGVDWPSVVEEEPDAGLGNGGLGRLAACFLDSMATLQLPAFGYGLRYEYGMFRQSIRDGWQEEQPDNWLRRPDPWEIARPEHAVEVHLGCGVELRDGRLQLIPNHPSTLVGIPFDRPVVGFGGATINTLRLWSAAPSESFDLQRFNSGDFVGALATRLAAETLTRVLYPDDSTANGRELRFVQEFFLAACSLADVVRRFRRRHTDWRALPEKVAVQINDTHPAFAVPELMRILLDEARLDWDESWRLTRATLAYTNHTLLAEALEKWPLEWFELLLPRQLEILAEINGRFLGEVRARFPGDEARVRRVSLIEEGPVRSVRMAHLAIVGSHSTNGVSEIHTELLRSSTVRDLAELFPERFNNKTNGVTPRRWLHLANPGLSRTISRAIGEGWITNLSELRKLRPLADDASFRREFMQAKRTAKAAFADWLKRSAGIAVDPSSVFDCHVKRIHEYKRQLLNALRIVVLYQELRDRPDLEVTPRTFFFAGKAASAYRLAKLIIKFLNNLAGTIDSDPSVAGRLKVVFLPEYDVSLSERLIPAADVSNQISTAGYEASGTGNMKFMMNGALTLGTRDGANIEMAAQAGEENLFLFGLTAQQVAASRGWYSPRWHYDHEPRTRAALDLIFSGQFSRYEPELTRALRQTLIEGGDFYMHLADLTSYLEADARLMKLYQHPDAAWAGTAILNVGSCGYFSSDRTVSQYATEIWQARSCPVE